MHFDHTHVQGWKLDDAVRTYKLAYEDEAIDVFITTLKTIMNDPNRLVLAKARARVFLKRISPVIKIQIMITYKRINLIVKRVMTQSRTIKLTKEKESHLTERDPYKL
jgi:hypothetical protein